MGVSRSIQITWLYFLFFSAVHSQLNSQNPLGYQANISSSCYSTCESISSLLGDKVSFNGFSGIGGNYFSVQQTEVIPACVVLPTSAQDVSDIVKIINQNDCIFAIKSGGHAMFAGASSAPGGITLDLRYLNDIAVSDDQGTAFIGTGNRWGDVYNYLDPLNITVVGGRDMQVGVGGFLLGGGISFISRRYGWALDRVRNYEVVLANGSMSSISQSTHPDLYWALRGGGKNFGIVTRFDLETFPQGTMYGGMSLILLSDVKKSFARLGISRAFSWTAGWFLEQVAEWANQAGCLFGYCITIAEFARHMEWSSAESQLDLDAQCYGWLILLPYSRTYIAGVEMNHAKGSTDASAYREIEKIKKIYSTNRLTNSTDFAQEISKSNIQGTRQTYNVASFKVNAQMLTKAMDIFMSEMDPIRNIDGLLPAMVMQVLTKREIAGFSKNGGNALGIKEEDGPLTILLVANVWKNKSDDEVMLQASRNIIDRAVAASKEMGLDHPYIYQNYAAKNQDVFAGYGPENRKKLKDIQKKYDPEGIFSRLQPGYFQL